MKLTIDGQVVEAEAGESVLEASLRAGIYIPAICYHPDFPPFSQCEPSGEIFRGDEKICAESSARYRGCGLCAVQIEGSESPALACETPAEPGIVVHTNTELIKKERRKALSRILKDHPRACLLCAQKEGCPREPCSTDVPKEERCCPLLGRCELEKVVDFVGAPQELGKHKALGLPVLDDEPLFTRDYNLCIGCTRCVRACRDLRGVDALGYISIDGSVLVGTVKGPSLADAGCMFCGACVEVCPTGALVDRRSFTLADREKTLLPCRAECPADIDVPAYVRAIEGGRHNEALRIICESVPFPLILGMVCHHPCEESCRRGEVDEPVAICDLKRFAAEMGDYPPASPPYSSTGKRVAVVGSGPAGLAAGFYLRSKGHAVTLFERDAEPGGMLRYAIPAYRLPQEALDKELERALRGIELRTRTAVGHDLTVEHIREEGFHAILLCTGAGQSKKLDIPGIQSGLVYWGIDFLKLVRTGKRPHLGDRTIVIGGGNVALDVALCCLRMGPEVELICLERESEMPAFKKEIETAREEGLSIRNGWGPRELLLSDGKPKELVLARCTRVFNEKGNFSPQFDDLNLQAVSLDSLIVAIGQSPDSSFLSSSGMPAQDPLGHFTVNRMKTNLRDVFAAGDAVRGPSSVIEAVADGRRAAQEIDLFLGGDGVVTQSGDHPAESRIGKAEGLDRAPRTRMRVLEPDARMKSFEAIELGLESDEAIRESRRCLQCDLRLRISGIVLPPEKWTALEPDSLADVPRKEGVYQLADEKKKVVKIAGTQNLKGSLEAELENGKAPFFCYEEDPMYTKRESELIQQHLQKYGELPGGQGDLDDLF